MLNAHVHMVLHGPPEKSVALQSSGFNRKQMLQQHIGWSCALMMPLKLSPLALVFQFRGTCK